MDELGSRATLARGTRVSGQALSVNHSFTVEETSSAPRAARRVRVASGDKRDGRVEEEEEAEEVAVDGGGGMTAEEGGGGNGPAAALDEDDDEDESEEEEEEEEEDEAGKDSSRAVSVLSDSASLAKASCTPSKERFPKNQRSSTTLPTERARVPYGTKPGS